MVAIAVYAIPKRSLNIEEVLLITLTVLLPSILDTYVPAMAVSARSGAGSVLALTLLDSQDFKLFN